VGLLGHIDDNFEARYLLIIFGIGFAAVHLIFVLLYLHALRMRHALDLTPVERLRTIQGLVTNLFIMSNGLVSMALALLLPMNRIGWAGYFYLVLLLYAIASRAIFHAREKGLLRAT